MTKPQIPIKSQDPMTKPQKRANSPRKTWFHTFWSGKGSLGFWLPAGPRIMSRALLQIRDWLYIAIMLSFHCTPAVPAGKTAGAFIQTIQLRDGERVLGRAIWSAADPSQGVVQIVELWVEPKVRRGGHGRRLFRELIEQARAFHKPSKQIVRRLWIAVGHKSQVIGRAFLTGEGFHHISTTGGVYQDEDQLIYVKSLD